MHEESSRRTPHSEKTRHVLFISVLVGVSLFFVYLLSPFLFPLFWAAVLASIFRPLYLWFNRKWNHSGVSITATFFIIIIIIVLPGVVVGSLLFSESMKLYESFGSDGGKVEEVIKHISGKVQENPYCKKIRIDEKFWAEKMTEIVRGISSYIFQHLRTLTQNTIIFLAQCAVMLYTLFFFIRDGDIFLTTLKRFFSLGENRETILFEQFVATARSTLKVTLIIGGIQGTLGGFLFWATGIEGSLVWGVLMIFLSILPVVGCSIIWVPAGVIMVLMGHVGKGIFILLFGVFVISMVDNLLRPLLIGRDVQMHPLLIFLSTLGGIALLGFSGFVIGPIVVSLLLSVWAMYDHI